MLDKFLISAKNHWAIPALRICLGIVFVWFGALKIFGVSPVADFVTSTYSFMPQPSFLIILGIWELAIGLGFIFKIALRFTLLLFLVQMTGTLFAFFLTPSKFFIGDNPMLLTFEGEFLVKNLVLITAGIVIAAYEGKKRSS